MGQRVYIKAKTKEIGSLNILLAKAKIKNSFVTEKDTIDWLNDINTNPKAYQRHLKPADRDLTVEELKSFFPYDTEVGLLSFDVAFSRTTDKEAAKYAKFIEENEVALEHVIGGDSFLDKFNLTANQIKIFAALDKPEPEPEVLPKEEQTHPNLQGGLYLCRSFSPDPFWLVFGNVTSPVFLKVRKYKEDIYNNIYRDKKGYAYLMIPLLPLFHSGDKQVEFVSKVFDAAFQMGLRENFNFIIPIIYGLDLTSYEDAARDYMEHYSIEELKERFYKLFEYTSSVYQYNYPQGFVWSDDKKKFVPIGGEGTSQIRSRCSVLTVLLWAMGGQAAAELMTKLTGRKHLVFEFKPQLK